MLIVTKQLCMKINFQHFEINNTDFKTSLCICSHAGVHHPLPEPCGRLRAGDQLFRLPPRPQQRGQRHRPAGQAGEGRARPEPAAGGGDPAQETAAGPDEGGWDQPAGRPDQRRFDRQGE